MDLSGHLKESLMPGVRMVTLYNYLIFTFRPNNGNFLARVHQSAIQREQFDVD